MIARTITWLLSAGLLLSASMAHAQPTFGAVTTAPKTITSEESSFQYQSAFTHYHSFNEQPVLPWRETNDTVGKIGGWRFYAREGQQPDSDGTPLKPGAADTRPPLLPAVNSNQHHEHGSKP